MADKEPMIVIKKITIQAAGHHGGAWKVAFADFMTALMAFFLVMWLVAQSEEVKKNVADYFSTPSIIEYNFSNYGVELTLEKLFLDLVNEPLKFFQTFIKPVDYSPNIMAMGSKKVVMFHVADKLGALAKNVEINSDEMIFEIEAKELFFIGTARPTRQYVEVIDKVQKLTMGLEDSIIYIDSQIYKESVDSNLESSAKSVADKRLAILLKSIETTLEHDTVDIFGRTNVENYGKPLPPGTPPTGLIRFNIKQKIDLKDGKLPRKLEGNYGEDKKELDVYNNFVNKLVDKKKNEPKGRKNRRYHHPKNKEEL